MEEGQLVITERRGALGLALVEKVSPAKVRIRFDDGAENKVGQDRIVHVFECRFPSPEAFRQLQRWLREHRASSTPLTADELEALWRSLPDDEAFSFSVLCQRSLGGSTDPQALALFDSLQIDSSLVRAHRGQLFRIPANQREAAKSRAAEASLENQLVEAFEAWRRDNKSVGPGPRPGPWDDSPFLKEVIALLRDYAIAGAQSENRRGQRIAARSGYKTPEDLLDELCALGLVEVDVNEGPARIGWNNEHPRSIQSASANAQEELRRLESLGAAESNRGSLPQKAWTCTIDQDSTEDVDDAISYWPEGDGFGFAVHIVDVDAAVSKGSTLDIWARERASSIYFRDTVWSMLPAELVRDGLSLSPTAHRPCISLIGGCDKEARLLAPPELSLTLVKVDDRLSYDDTRRAPWRDDPRLCALGQLAEQLRKRRLKQGAVLVVQQQLEIRVQGSELSTRLVAFDSPGHGLVQELMVLFSQSAGELLARQSWPAFYRCQPVPLQNAGSVLVDSEDEGLSTLSRRFPPSRVSLEPGSHKTMGVPVYAQATAPIRRYSDLITQRLMKAAIRGDDSPYSREELGEILQQQENRMSQIRRLEDQRLRHWQHRALEQDPGPRRALVSRPGNRRPFVYFPDLMLELPLDSKSLDRGSLEAGQELEVLATEFSPRGHVLRVELADGLDDADWDEDDWGD